MLKLEQLSQIFHGELLLLGSALSAGQLKARIALHHLNQVSFLLPLRHLQIHLAAAPIPQPSLEKFLLWQGVLQQHLRRQFHWIQLAVVLLKDPLQDGAWLGCLRIRGEAQTTHQLSGPDLKELHSGDPVIGGQSNHITADPSIGERHFLISREQLQALELVAHPGSGFKVEPFGVAHHLLLEQVLQFLIAALKHHRHLAQDLLVIGRADFFLTHTGATTDVVVQAGAVFMQRLRPLAQRKHPFHHREGSPQQANVNIGAVKAIQRTAKTAPPGDENARVILTPGDAEVGIFLVILQQHIEMRLMVFDQVGFQR